MAFKIDKYTRIKKNNNGEILAFNFRNGALAKFDSDLGNIEELSNKEKLFELSEIKNKDFLLNFMIPEEIDPGYLVKTRFDTMREADNTLSFTILTTLACNFNCYYCYEKRNSKFLSIEIEDKIIQQVIEKVPNLKTVSLSWYGGEPLLLDKSIYRVNNAIKAICEDNNIIFGSYLISNCYLLNRNKAEKLRESGVTGIQVSLDGDRTEHNKVRNQNGKPSFDVICENVRNSSDLFNFSIRVNVSEKNKYSIQNLISQLKEYNLHESSSVYFANLHGNGLGCSDITEQELHNLIKTSSFTSEALNFTTLAFNHGFKIKSPLFNKSFCCAHTNTSLVIEPDGDIKKCYIDIGDNNESLGKICSNECNEKNVKKWAKYDPYKNAGCKDCEVLPMCYSGCPWMAIHKIPRKERCHPLKTLFDEYITFFFDCLDKGAEFNQKDQTLQLKK